MDKHTAVAHAVKIKSSWLQQSLGEEFATTRTKEQNSARNNYFFSCSFWMLAVVRRCKGAGRPVGIKPCSDLKKKRSNTTSPSPLFHFKHSVKGLRLSLKLLRASCWIFTAGLVSKYDVRAGEGGYLWYLLPCTLSLSTELSRAVRL